MLIKDVVQTYDGRVEFVSENWGESRLAEHYGVKRYPAVFVDDILIASPNDFGGWSDSKGGKYVPWRDKANHDKFQKELTRMIDQLLKGERALAAEGRSTTTEEEDIAQLPALKIKDLAGREIDSTFFAGKPVVVEFWATWCPPCLSTLTWLGDVKRHSGDKLVVLAVAVESEETDVRKRVNQLDPSLSFVMASPEFVAPFGTVGSVPRIFVFDSTGKTAGIFYGATPDLHDKLGKLIDNLAK
ncbi:MAG TPA: TlpA disulfide reductase family protein [Pyrinomonadaceae bacterium]|nr:TlpA disulfide reductase family protein [Pyrinomonadaceae bacterium]